MCDTRHYNTWLLLSRKFSKVISYRIGLLLCVVFGLQTFTLYGNGLNNLTSLELLKGLINTDDGVRLSNLLNTHVYALEKVRIASPGVWLTRIHLELYFDRIEAAREIASRVPPGDYQRFADLFVGRAIVKQGNIEETVEVWLHAGAQLYIADLGLDLAEQGKELVEAGDVEQALVVWGKAFQIWKGMCVRKERLPPHQFFSPIILELSQGLLEEQKYEDALETLLFLLDFTPESSSLHRRVGVVYTLTGDYLLAEHWLNKAINLNKDDYKNYTARAKLAVGMGKPSEVIDYMHDAFVYAPEDQKANIAVAISELYYNSQDVVAAIEWLSMAIDLQPEQIEYRLVLAEYFVIVGKKDAAIQQYQVILKINPNNQLAIDALGTLITTQPY